MTAIPRPLFVAIVDDSPVVVARETGAPVLAYVWDPDQEQVADAMRAGAAGFASKALDGAAALAAIVALIVAGKSNQTIAFSLDLSEEDVRTHIPSAYAKMGVTSRTQAVVRGIQHRLGITAPKAHLNGGGQP